MASNSQHDLCHLARTTAAREATAEEQSHGAVAKKYDRMATGIRLPHSRRSSHGGTPTGKVGENSGGDYFATAPSRSRSTVNLRSGQSTPLPMSPGPVAHAPLTIDTHHEKAQDIRRDSGVAKSPYEPTVLIKVGPPLKQFELSIKKLINMSPYFRNMGKDDKAIAADDPTSPTDISPLDIQRFGNGLEFPDLDEFAFGLFERYVNGIELSGPWDFHSVHHYLGLYIIGKKFDIEDLRNKVMDFIRHYYRENSMTASPFRLDYIYNNITDRTDMMRKFLITTAAYRALCGDKNVENSEGGITETMRDFLRKGGDLAVDYAVQIVYLTKNNLPDVRKEQDYDWHMHLITREDKPPAPEIYEGLDEEM